MLRSNSAAAGKRRRRWTIGRQRTCPSASQFFDPWDEHQAPRVPKTLLQPIATVAGVMPRGIVLRSLGATQRVPDANFRWSKTTRYMSYNRNSLFSCSRNKSKLGPNVVQNRSALPEFLHIGDNTGKFRQICMDLLPVLLKIVPLVRLCPGGFVRL